MDDDKIWRSARVCWGYQGERRGFLFRYLSSHLFQSEPVFKGLVKNRFQSDV